MDEPGRSVPTYLEGVNRAGPHLDKIDISVLEASSLSRTALSPQIHTVCVLAKEPPRRPMSEVW
jgi:hypothetical protein